jgi:hypothetical protein
MGRAVAPIAGAAAGVAGAVGSAAVSTAATHLLYVFNAAMEKGTAVSGEVMGALNGVKDGAAEFGPELVAAVNGMLAQAMSLVDDDTVNTLQQSLLAAAQAGHAGLAQVSGQCQQVVGQLAAMGRAVAPIAGAAVGVAGAVGSVAAGAGMDAARAAGKAAGGAAVAAGGAAMAGARAGVAAGQDFFQSPMVQGAAVEAWGALDSAYTMSREQLASVMAAAAGAALGCAKYGIDLIKFDVVRDFFQMLSLYISSISSEAMVKAKAFWGNISGIIAFDWAYSFSIPAYVFYIFLGIVGFIIFVVFIYAGRKGESMTSDKIREGHEASNWKEKQEESKKLIKFIKIVLTVAFSAYLPVSRTVFQVFACEAQLGKALMELTSQVTCSTDGKTVECNCSNWDYYLYLVIGAVVLLIFFTIGLPLYSYRLIKKNKPVGSTEDPDKRYDEDGEMQDYTDSMYHQDVMHDPNQVACPFRFMYKGYERKWAFYKVFVMCFKFACCLPVIFLWNRPVIQSIITLLLLSVSIFFSYYSSPFIEDSADMMETSGRITAFTTVLFGFISTHDVAPASSTVMVVLINICNALNALIMLGGALIGIPKIKRTIKDFRKRFEFDDTSTDQTGTAAKIIPGWDIPREVKHRVWHPFWQGLLYNKCGADVANRLQELEAITADKGIKRIRAHFEAMNEPSRMQMRQWVQESVEGVDVFWDGVSHDGHLDSATGFGKMYVCAYPFHCVMVYDDCDDYTFVWEEEFLQFCARNQDPEIQRRRQIRHQLRALKGQLVHLEHQAHVNKTVEDGTETHQVRQADGSTKSETKTRYSTITVLMHYHRGTLNVGANKDMEFAAGFKPSIHYADGHGEGRAPHTGKVHHFQNETATVGKDVMGITDQFEMTPRLTELLMDGDNQPLWQAGLPQLFAYHQQYRQKLLQNRFAKEQILSSAFWLKVYFNDNLPYDELVYYLTNFEANPVLRMLPVEHLEGLKFLYQRLAYVKSHPCSALWFCFWDSFWANNKEMKLVKPHADRFDTNKPSSLAYRPLPQAQLDPILKELELRDETKLFSDEVITLLYQRMMQFNQEWMKKGPAV